jgi:uncharacterized protein (DUF1015 family)
MADIRPFRAVRYNPEVAVELGQLVTQPYDKISAEMQSRYYETNPHNLVRIILGRRNPGDSSAENVYTRAAADFRRWVEVGILKSDGQPAIYAYDQEYEVPGQPGVTRLRRGFIALARIEDYAAGVVHRHEETLAGPKADRLELLKATRAHCEQLFLLYSDPAGEIEGVIDRAAPSAADFVTDEYGVRHSLRKVDDGAAVAAITAAMRAKKLVIADGHHRYETAIAYRDSCRAQGPPSARSDFVMMTFVRKESDGLSILPTHRVVHSLAHFEWNAFLIAAKSYYDVETFSATGDSAGWAGRLTSQLEESGRSTPTLAVYGGRGSLALLKLRSGLSLAASLPDVTEGLRRLDVILLHRLVIEHLLGIDRQAVREEKNLHYVRGCPEALAQVDHGKAQLCFLMNPTTIDQVWENALAGQPLPQKSTDFYPKMLSGLAMYWLDNPLGM